MTAINGSAARLPRPQPLGLCGGPAGLLLVPPGAGVAELLADLAAGREPGAWPPAADAFRAARDGDLSGALAAVEQQVGTGGRLGAAVAATNRLVLAPSPTHFAEAAVAAAGDPRLEVVVAAAGYASELTTAPPSSEGVDGEFAALALVVRATGQLQRGEADGALRLLRLARPHAAAVGPALHARVLGLLAAYQQQAHGPDESVLDLYDQAVAWLAGTDLTELRASMELERGLVAHQLAEQQRHRLIEAIRDYQSSLAVLTEHQHPEAFALANMNVAVAILSMTGLQPADQIRLAIAVQALRAALRVYTPATHPKQWSVSQTTLANALQSLPSPRREENLQEAVRLYEEVLARHSPNRDPEGYARVLANQATALAHLGLLEEARTRYLEARRLLQRLGDDDAVDLIDRRLAGLAAEQAAPR